MSLKGREFKSAVWFSNVSGHQNSLKIYVFIHLGQVLVAAPGSFIVACELSSLTGTKSMLPALRGRVLAGLSRKFLEFSIRLLLYICLCPAPKAEPPVLYFHTLCGVLTQVVLAGGEKWAEFGKTEGGNAGPQNDSDACLSWAVLADLRHRQQEVSGWMWRGLSTSLMSPTQNPEWSFPARVSKGPGADISIWPSSGVRRSW